MSVLFKTEEDRMNVPTIEYGDQFKIKVADLDEMVKILREERKARGANNLIEIKAIRTKREKEMSKVIKYSKDPISGIYYGIVVRIYDDGNVKWRGIYLADYNTFNLDKDFEAKCYIVLSMHPSLKGCPINTSVDPEFEIIDPDEIAMRSYSKAMLIKQALQKVSTMNKDSIEPFARYLELPVGRETTVKMIRNMIADMAILNPGKVINAFEDRNRPLFEMIAMAKKVGVIRYDVERGHIFADHFIGWTAPEAARVLEQDEIMLARIRNKLQEKDVVLYSTDNDDDATEPVKESAEDEISQDEFDAENEEPIQKLKGKRSKK
jgi:hypothetical protein